MELRAGLRPVLARLADYVGRPLRGLPVRPLGSNPRDREVAGFQVPSGFLRLIACGCVWLRESGFSEVVALRALRVVASISTERWQNVGKRPNDAALDHGFAPLVPPGLLGVLGLLHRSGCV